MPCSASAVARSGDGLDGAKAEAAAKFRRALRGVRGREIGFRRFRGDEAAGEV
jgi:hypothetical protein